MHAPVVSRNGSLEFLQEIAEAAGALLLAESRRRWLGELRRDPEGDKLRDSSQRWMSEQGVHDPDRFAHLTAPGFAEV